jgi:hypothetical protein
MTDDLEKYAQFLDSRYKVGEMNSTDLMKANAEFAALVATKRLSFYGLLSTIAAAISALASAAAAIFAYLGVHH